MILRARSHTLRLKHEFTLSSGSRTTTPCVLIELEAAGVTGLGEASMPPYYGETTDTALDFLSKAEACLSADASDLGSGGLEAIARVLAAVERLVPGNHAAKAAVDIALHDWLGKTLGAPCHRLLRIPPGPIPPTSFTIGIAGLDQIRARVSEADQFRVLKVKLGTGHDREIIETIRAVTPRTLRVDANQGWTDRDEAARLTEWLAGKGVELVEQPFPRERAADTAWLRERSPLPLVADESAVRFVDLEGLAGVFDGVNIKLMKCTGMAEAFRMIGEAKRLGLRVMMGCMTETSCGISAAVQLAPLADWVDLDGALLITNDPFIGTSFDDGRPIMPQGPGIGVSPREPFESQNSGF